MRNVITLTQMQTTKYKLNTKNKWPLAIKSKCKEPFPQIEIFHRARITTIQPRLGLSILAQYFVQRFPNPIGKMTHTCPHIRVASCILICWTLFSIRHNANNFKILPFFLRSPHQWHAAVTVASAVSILLSAYQTRSHFALPSVQMMEIISSLCPMHILIKCGQTLIAGNVVNGVYFQYGLLAIRITDLSQCL